MINNRKQKNMGMGWGLRSKLVKMDHSIEYGRQNEEQNNRDAKQVGHNITIIY
jgi:hypothetical protein